VSSFIIKYYYYEISQMFLLTINTRRVP
jgi:hypothetical protein